MLLETVTPPKFFIRTWLDGRTSKKIVPKGTSKTVPNQALTVADIIKRAQNGQPLDKYDNTVEAVYNPNFEIPEVKKLDFIRLTKFF